MAGTRGDLWRGYAIKALPAQLSWALAMLVLTVVMFWAANGLGQLGVVALIGLAAVLARFSMVIPVSAVRGRGAWTISDGRGTRTTASILLGVVAAPLFLLWLSGLVAERVGVFGYPLPMPVSGGARARGGHRRAGQT